MPLDWNVLYRFYRVGVKPQVIIFTCVLCFLDASIGETVQIAEKRKVKTVFFATEGGSISLRCPCEKNATVSNFAWLCPKREYFSKFSQQLVSENHHNKIIDKTDYRRIPRRTIINGSLLISTVCGSDTGIYKCHAEKECLDCTICQATVQLEVSRLSEDGDLALPACSTIPTASLETYHYIDWTYGALIFSAGIVAGLALAMIIVIFRKRSRKRFGSRRSDRSTKDSLTRPRSVFERSTTESLRHASHLLQKTRTISHRWMPMSDESFQECQSIMTAFDDPDYGMYVNPLRTRQSSRGSSMPTGPPPLPPRKISTKYPSSVFDTSGYETADDTAVIRDNELDAEDDSLEDSDGYVRMTLPSRPNSEMPTLGRCTSFYPSSSILKDFTMSMKSPETNVHVSYIEFIA